MADDVQMRRKRQMGDEVEGDNIKKRMQMQNVRVCLEQKQARELEIVKSVSRVQPVYSDWIGFAQTHTIS